MGCPFFVLNTVIRPSQNSHRAESSLTAHLLEFSRSQISFPRIPFAQGRRHIDFSHIGCCCDLQRRPLGFQSVSSSLSIALGAVTHTHTSGFRAGFSIYWPCNSSRCLLWTCANWACSIQCRWVSDVLSTVQTSAQQRCSGVAPSGKDCSCLDVFIVVQNCKDNCWWFAWQYIEERWFQFFDLGAWSRLARPHRILKRIESQSRWSAHRQNFPEELGHPVSSASTKNPERSSHRFSVDAGICYVTRLSFANAEITILLHANLPDTFFWSNFQRQARQFKNSLAPWEN